MTYNQGLVHVTSDHGHRASYSELAVGCFDLKPSFGKIRWKKWRELVAAPRLFLATIDDDLAGVVAVIIARSFTGRKTAGLFLRPKQCFHPGWRFRAKRSLFMTLRRVPGLSLFTIIPFELFPKFSKISADWVHDPQLWDLIESAAETTPLSAEILAKANGRKILTFLGVVSTNKGFPFFSEIASAIGAGSQEIMLVAAGKVTEACEEAAQNFVENGGILVDRYLDDDELLSLFSVSDMIWSCYDPKYDQASGAFGRSLQFQRFAVVRRGSIIQRYAELAGVTALLLDFGDAEGSAGVLRNCLPDKSLAAPAVPLESWREEFINKIGRAMGSE